MNSIDIFVQNYFSMVRTQSVTEFFYVLTSFFDVTSFASFFKFTVITLCITVLIYLVRNVRYSILFVLTIFFGAISTYILKIIFNITRPTDAVILVSGQSFPSYHATIATVFFVMLMYIFDSQLKSVGRVIFNSLCIIGILLIVVSRVYLGVHWVSDVIGGIILGLLVSYISVIFFRRFNKKI